MNDRTNEKKKRRSRTESQVNARRTYLRPRLKTKIRTFTHIPYIQTTQSPIPMKYETKGEVEHETHVRYNEFASIFFPLFLLLAFISFAVYKLHPC